MTNWLLGDLPAAAFWLAALWLSLRAGPRNALAAGAATAMAIVIRPNLVPLAIVPAFLCARASTEPRRAALALAVFTGPVIVAALFIAWLFNDLYGSPFRSGYGANAELYSWSNFAPNSTQYVQWLATSHGPLIFLFPLSITAAARAGQPAGARAALAAFIVLVFAAYLFYIPFDVWWYIRFLLPAVPVMFLLSADAIWTSAGPRVWTRRAGLLLFTVFCVGYGLRESFGREVFDIGREQAKHAALGTWVDRHLPRHAVVYSMQHSGTLRHYSDRLTIRWDLIDGAWLDRSVAFMIEQGYEPYLLLDDWEIPLFQRHFASQRGVQVLAHTPAIQPGAYDAVLWELRDPTRPDAFRFPRYAP